MTGVTWCPASASRGASAAPTFPLHEARADRLHGLEEALFGRPDRGDGERLGRQQHLGELRDRVGVHRLDLRQDAVEVEQLAVGDERLPEPAHAVRRQLHGEHDPALEVLLRPLELVRPGAVLGDVGDLLGHDAQALAEVLLPRPDIHPDLSRVRVLGGECVDGVGEAALLPDLLEQPRGGGAAEHAVEDGGREAAAVRARDPRRGEADVVLLRRLRLEDE
jgi:hypothetical protein